VRLFYITLWSYNNACACLRQQNLRVVLQGKGYPAHYVIVLVVYLVSKQSLDFPECNPCFDLVRTVAPRPGLPTRTSHTTLTLLVVRQKWDKLALLKVLYPIV
jgi:hypothetical protein